MEDKWTIQIQWNICTLRKRKELKKKQIEIRQFILIANVFGKAMYWNKTSTNYAS